MTETKTVEVTQAVRDAAADAVVASDGESLYIRMGQRDDLAVVQAFARHRLASQSLSSDIEAAVEALSNLIALARPHFSDPSQMLALEQAGAALAALKETPNVE